MGLLLGSAMCSLSLEKREFGNKESHILELYSSFASRCAGSTPPSLKLNSADEGLRSQNVLQSLHVHSCFLSNQVTALVNLSFAEGFSSGNSRGLYCQTAMNKHRI